jgi:hypothetical protein
MARRFHRIRHRVRSHAGPVTNSIVSLGTGGAVGVASTYLASAIRSVPVLGQAWWSLPLATGLVGHFLKGKHPTVGGALLGVSGFWAANVLMHTNSGQTHAIGTAAAAQGFIDAGFIDAGRYAVGGSDAGALSYNDNIGTDAAPSLGTAQAAMLIAPSRTTMGLESESGDLVEAYGLSD